MSTIDPNPFNIDKFLNSSSSGPDKCVLYLKNKILKTVSLSETTLFERIQAWFGCGPLSLQNISNFIQANSFLNTIDCNDLPVAYNSSSKKANFALKLIEKYEHFNRTHTINKINEKVLDELIPLCQLAFFDVTFSEGLEKEKKLTFAYSDANQGFAYIVDIKEVSDTLHPYIDNPDSLSSQLEQYAFKIKNENFDSVDKALEDFKKETGEFIEKFNQTQIDFCVVHKVKIKGAWFLLRGYQGTPTLFIKHADGTIERTQRFDSTTPVFVAKPISRTDVIVGASNGISDYIEEENMVQILKNLNTFDNIKLFKSKLELIIKDKPVIKQKKSKSRITRMQPYPIKKTDNQALFILR